MGMIHAGDLGGGGTAPIEVYLVIAGIAIVYCLYVRIGRGK